MWAQFLASSPLALPHQFHGGFYPVPPSLLTVTTGLPADSTLLFRGRCSAPVRLDLRECWTSLIILLEPSPPLAFYATAVLAFLCYSGTFSSLRPFGVGATRAWPALIAPHSVLFPRGISPTSVAL